MNFLFLKPKQIGDSLILTPTLQAVKQAYPEAKIWVVVRRGCEGILAGCPAIDHLLTAAPVEARDHTTGQWWRSLQLVSNLRKVRFDAVFELGDGDRSRWLALLCRAKARYSVPLDRPMKGYFRQAFKSIADFEYKRGHRVEKDYRTVSTFLPLPEEIPPLVFNREATRVWPETAAWEDFALMHITSRQGFNRWTREGWIKVGQYLLTRYKNLLISTGPAHEETVEAKAVAEALGPACLPTLGRTNWAELAELLYRARLFVGIDTAARHLAAACQCPTVALFGPSIERHWHPWKSPHRIVTVPGYHAPQNGELEDEFRMIKARRMNEIRAESVIEACSTISQWGHKGESEK
ncbi:MAG: glycosyltransferase family 9 protein [Verrucomicrobiota bacterium]|nr:glycosyltransferase family 9 protein [Verrucomicrobiota bacterium]